MTPPRDREPRRPPRPVRGRDPREMREALGRAAAARGAAERADAERGGRRPRGRQRASHSLESVLTETVALLDESGEGGLNFRALAHRLGGGVGSIYWYVSSKDELLDRASDHVLADVLAAVEDVGGGDPVDDMRTIAVTLFDATVDRPWLGAYFMRNTLVQPNALLLFEKLGEQALRLDLTARQRFHAVSAVVGFVVGTAADLGQEPPQEVLSGEVGRDEYLGRAVAQWRETDPEQFPYLHEIADEFEGHDDVDQFRAGLDLLLAGLRLQAGGGQVSRVTR